VKRATALGEIGLSPVSRACAFFLEASVVP
jgi:hypothetical protein